MPTLKVCTGQACSNHGSAYLIDRAKAELGPESKVVVETCGCLGQCEQAPTVALEHSKKRNLHTNVSGPKLAKIIKQHLL